tara:strand:- start:171 stop:881 length:711 start_codon:yes stop_codon:yes gene_type:complete
MKKFNIIKLLHYFSKLFCVLAIIFAVLWIPCLIYGTYGREVNLKVNMHTADVFWEKKIIIPNNSKQLKNSESDTTDESTFIIIDDIVSNSKITNNIVFDLSHQEAQHNVYLHSLPLKHRILIMLSSITTLLLIIFIGYKFKFFMGKITYGLYFTLETMKSLKYMSYGLIFIWIDSYTSRYILQNFSSSSKQIFENHINVVIKFPSISLLVFALFLWVLAHIFSNGILLKEESKLTI